MSSLNRKYTLRALEFLITFRPNECINDAIIEELRRLFIVAYSEGVEVGAKLNAE